MPRSLYPRSRHSTWLEAVTAIGVTSWHLTFLFREPCRISPICNLSVSSVPTASLPASPQTRSFLPSNRPSLSHRQRAGAAHVLRLYPATSHSRRPLALVKRKPGSHDVRGHLGVGLGAVVEQAEGVRQEQVIQFVLDPTKANANRAPRHRARGRCRSLAWRCPWPATRKAQPSGPRDNAPARLGSRRQKHDPFSLRCGAGSSRSG